MTELIWDTGDLITSYDGVTMFRPIHTDPR